MNIGRNDKCWCGSGKKYKSCHMGFDEKIKESADAAGESIASQVSGDD